jgi:glycosyltransferase involved in cell wall biosynthesis
VRVAFFVRGISESDLERSEFYAMDLRILRSLGHDVYWASGATSVSSKTDLIYCWWWTYAWLALLAALPRRIPVIATGVFDVHRYPSRPLHERILIAEGFRRCSANVVVSRYELERIPRLVSGPISFYYSPLAVDTQVYRPAATGRDRERFLIANLAWKRATNMRRKLLPHLIEAMRFVVAAEPRARLVLAGPPEDGESELRRLTSSLGLDNVIEFRGAITRTEKVALFRQCDVYVQCSRYEGFGLAIAEAMACGAPVLVSPVGAVPEVVGNAGRYVSGERPEEIGAALVSLLRDPARADLGREGSRRVASEFAPERRARDLAGVINAVLGAKAKLS